jgi:DNA-binding GntR family transcriptional regulator
MAGLRPPRAESAHLILGARIDVTIEGALRAMVNNSLASGRAPRIQRAPLREQAAAQIKELVLTNRLRPGQTLVIGELADYLGVSHTPVREALAMLEREGLVEMPPYGKPRVTRIEAKDVQDVWEMRLLLESAVIDEAVSKLPDQVLDDLDQGLTRARHNADDSDYNAHYQSDIALHRAIVECADNDLFLEIARQVEDRSIRIRTLVEAVANGEHVIGIVDEHIRLLEALKARDEDAARESLTAHLEAGKERTLAALEELRSGE